MTLIFNHAVMGAGKSAVLIARATSLRNSVLVMKPAKDTRDGVRYIKSRNGQSLEVDASIYPDSNITEIFLSYFASEVQTSIIKYIFIDESQFLTKENIEELMHIGYTYNVRIECFGLLVNFQSELFEGSKRLIELSDEIIEIPSFDSFGDRAVQNARIVEGKIVRSGPETMLGKDELYEPVSNKRYFGDFMERGDI